ncbi:MAG: hypothetical protein WD069_08935 [Planctomycetales bacterium]
MKTLIIELPDDLYDRAERRAAERGISLEEEVVGLVEQLGGEKNGDALTTARSRMQELFNSVHGFRLTFKIPREELYDRGRVH